MVATVVAAVVVGNYVYQDVALVIRLAGVIIGLGLAAAMSLTTVKGKAAWNFAKEARIETKKVIWPTRQETLQTAFYVFIVTLIAGFLLWLLDAILVEVIAFLTGQGA
jgi:preprotein translocase subunit SecE